MATQLEPIVGDWYSYRGKDFTVIDVDEDEGFVEIQYANGNVQQVDLNAWYDMDLEPTEEPEAWDSDLEEDVVVGGDAVSRSSRWVEADEDEDLDEDEEDDDDEDDDDDDDWAEEDEEDEELEDEWRDRRSEEDDSWDEH
jgi:Family of unknown function (DUF6763)